MKSADEVQKSIHRQSESVHQIFYKTFTYTQNILKHCCREIYVNDIGDNEISIQDEGGEETVPLPCD